MLEIRQWARISGRLINFGLGKESVRGTAVAPTFWLPKTDADFDDKVEKLLDESGYGVIDKTADAHIKKEWSEGKISGIAFRDSFGMILMALFGATSTDTVVETTAKSHAFALATNNQHQSLTIGCKDANADLAFALGMLDKLTITVAVGEYIKYEAVFKAKKSATASPSQTPAYTSETQFIPKMAAIKIATNTAGIAGATAIKTLKTLKLEFSKNLDDTQGIGDSGLEGINNLSFEVKGVIEKYLDDTTYKGYFTANDHKALQLKIVDTATTVGAVTNPSLTFDFPEIVFTSWSKGMGNDSTVTETLDFVGLWNLTETKTVSATLVNATATY